MIRFILPIMICFLQRIQQITTLSVLSTRQVDQNISILAQLGQDKLMTCTLNNKNQSKVTVFSMTDENLSEFINFPNKCNIIAELKGEGSYQYAFYAHSKGFDKITLTQQLFSGFRLNKNEMLNDSSYDVTYYKNYDSFNFIIGLKTGKLYFYNPILFKDEFKGCTSQIKGAYYMDKDDLVLAACDSRVVVWNKKKMEGILNWDYQIQNQIDIGSPINEFYNLEPVKERLLVVRSQRKIFIYWFQQITTITLMNTKIIKQDVIASKAYGNKIITLESDNKLRKWSAEKIDLISCSDGYFLNKNQICSKCSLTCKTCNDFNKCLTCNKDMNRIEKPINDACNCIENYFDFSLNEKCEKCHYSCLTCQTANNDKQCLSCDTSDSENGNRNIQIISSSSNGGVSQLNFQKCVCKDGYYEDKLTQKCKKCHYSCITCSNYQICIKCDSSSTTYRLVLDISGQCLCKEGYFDDGNQIQCQKCHFSCLTCERGNTQNFCTSCVANNRTNRLNLDTQKQCKCQIGFYDIKNDMNCQPCSNTCLTCSETNNKCDSCSQKQNRVLNIATHICECIAGYYPDPKSSGCIKCPYNCKTCNSPDKCQSCEDQNISKRKDVKSSEKCECLDGYFDDGINVKCKNCSYNCKTCSNKTNCTSCSTDNIANRNDFKQSEQCTCKDGYYDDGVSQNCKSCDYNCKKCIKKGECTSCIADNITNRQILNSQNQCNCKEGYYEELINSMNCKQCPNNCKTCDSKGQCLSCQVDTFTHRLDSIINGKCSCEDGYYDDSIQTNCQKCHPNCKTCNSFQQCTSCEFKYGRQFQQSPSICDCLPNYKDIGQQQCELINQCHYSCRSCSGPTKQDCIDCISSTESFREKSTNKNECICFKGYFEDEQAQVCKKCHSSCLECSGPSYNECKSCNNNQNRQFNLLTTTCDCNSNFYFDDQKQICVQCSPYCKLCKGPSKNDCLSCFEEKGRYIDGNSCNCMVEKNYYEIQEVVCYKKLACNLSCQDCSLFDPQECNSCSDQNAILTDNKRCKCKSGYFQNKNSQENSWKCKICSPECQTCEEKSDQCTSCQNNLLLNQKGICKDQFPTKFSNETIRTVYNVTETSAFVSVGATATASIVLSIASPNGNLVQQFMTLQKLNFLLLLDVAYPEILYIFFKALSGATPVESLQNFNVLYNYFISDNLKQEQQHFVSFDRKKLDAEKINSSILYNAGGTVTCYIITWILLLPVLFLYHQNKLIRGQLEVFSSFANYLKKIYEKIVSLIFLQVHEILTLVLHFSVYVSYVSFIIHGQDLSNLNALIGSTFAFHLYAVAFIFFIFYLINKKTVGSNKNSSLLIDNQQSQINMIERKQWLQVMRKHLISDFITTDKVFANFKFIYFLVESSLIPACVILLFRHFSAQITLCFCLQFLLFIYALKKRPHTTKLNNFLLIIDQLCWVLIFLFIGIISIVISRCLKKQYIDDSDINLIDSLSQVVIFTCLTIMFANPTVTIIKLISKFPTIITNLKNVYKKYKLSQKESADIHTQLFTKELYQKLAFQNKKTLIQSTNNVQLQLSSDFQSKSVEKIIYEDPSYLQRIHSVSVLEQVTIPNLTRLKLKQENLRQQLKSQRSFCEFKQQIISRSIKHIKNVDSDKVLSSSSNESDDSV